MPRRVVARRKRGGKRRVVKTRSRRLQPTNIFQTPSSKRNRSAAPTRAPSDHFNYRAGKGRGRTGASRVDAASGGVGGFTARRRTLRKKKSARMGSILRTLANNAYPVITDKEFKGFPGTQPDWASGTQYVGVFNVGYFDTEIQQMLVQANSAQTLSTLYAVAPSSTESLVNQRMDIYDRMSKFHFKNTCTHTVYLEIHAYESKGYHSFSPVECWQQALANDNMLQDAATYGTEEVTTNIDNRIKMARPEVNVRWKHVPAATYKICLEPGQETFYKYTQKGGRFDQQRFNLIQGSTATPVDCIFMPRLSSQIVVYCRGEMVADAADDDVTYGSGHLAMNAEVVKKWSAVPYLKPVQASFRNTWGTIAEASELDQNQYSTVVNPYGEQV